ncbi:TonB family protein [Massilia pseudoviolaceinigra]|uniref:TonB family protein n=1 Tax=Massilia pseudoviolaceinigra TaxID=3057165 RepID=UPI0027965043|nr:TonB family protein [Massilia sp. CCM 9206]MDQ1919296.1 TonB family protein [Massilia sp. CCM 9206]
MLAVLTSVSTNAPAQQDAAGPVHVKIPPALSANPIKPGSCAKPVFPKASLRSKQEGTVTLSFLIGTDGAVKGAKIVKSSGFHLLDMAAHDGIRRCVFNPTIVDGKAEEAWMQMQYVWTFDGPTAAEAAVPLPAVRAAAERGEPASQLRLGSIYMTGEGVARDPAEAFVWWRKAADQGDLKAHLSLARALHYGDSGKPDLVQAMVWYRKAADLGMPEAQNMLGLLLLNGAGVAADKVAADKVASREWFRKAAAQGWARSQAYYGSLLLDDNTPEGIEQGMALLSKAAAQDDFVGQFLLGQCYDAGRGVAQDKAMAATLFEKAALGGSKRAQRLMATMYERGEGVAADPVKADQWRKAAAIPPPRPR